MAICQRKGCRKRIPESRSVYCSAECYQKRYREYATAFQLQRQRRIRAEEARYQRAFERRTTKPKRRTCLGCDKLFDSAGPWNRICGRCARKEDRVQHRQVMKIPGVHIREPLK